uniref:ABC transporter domain-containing protein n=1 Tax=Cyprinus carpio TaxID=7962 RepID=A0A8C1Z3A9_CYPCA
MHLSCYCGENAIMGAAGSGKTSLLAVITGRKDPHDLHSGHVLVDNKVVTSDLPLTSAYVIQVRMQNFTVINDILMGTLTVRENLLFSGNLQLPRKQYSTADKKKRGEHHSGAVQTPRLVTYSTDVENRMLNPVINIFLINVLWYCSVIYFSGSKVYISLEKSLELKCITGPSDPSSEARSKPPYYVTSFFYQLKVVCWRTVLNIVRNPQTSYAQMALNIICALLIVLIYYQMPLTLPEALIGAFFFLIINMVFGNLSAVELFINEGAIFFLSKVFVDLLPNRIVAIFIFSSNSYFMMVLNPAFTASLCFSLTVSMVSLAGVSLAFLVSASMSSFYVLVLCHSLFLILSFFVSLLQVFGGFLVNLNSMLSWLSWLKWASIFKYGLDAVTKNEMKGQVFYSGNAMLKGEMYLQSQGIDYSVWGFWQNQVALLGIILVCMKFAYIQLHRINRWK